MEQETEHLCNAMPVGMPVDVATATASSADRLRSAPAPPTGSFGNFPKFLDQTGGPGRRGGEVGGAAPSTPTPAGRLATPKDVSCEPRAFGVEAGRLPRATAAAAANDRLRMDARSSLH